MPPMSFPVDHKFDLFQLSNDTIEQQTVVTRPRKRNWIQRKILLNNEVTLKTQNCDRIKPTRRQTEPSDSTDSTLHLTANVFSNKKI